MTVDAELEIQDTQVEDETGVEEGVDDGRLRGESIAIVRGLILKAHPELVEELVVGDTLTELMESVVGAQDAYRRIADSVRVQPVAVVAPVVPAGGNGARLVIEDLGADGLILRGMKELRRRAD